MTPRIVAVARACVVALGFVAQAHAADEPDVSAAPAPPAVDASGWHGFRIEPASLAATLEADHPSLARQIEIVEASGVPPEVLAFFRTVPIRIVDRLPRPPGEFIAGPRGGFVRILPDGMPADRPILLHELLHAYHADVVGLDQADVEAAYAKGKRSPAFPSRFQSAHFLENSREWFAVTSTIYLFGPIRQPPFDCTVLKKIEPEYVAFLATRYGPHDCR